MVPFRGLAAYPGSATRPLKALFTLITSPLAQEKRCFVLVKGSIERLMVSLRGGERGGGRGAANSERVLLQRLLEATVIGLVQDSEDT